MSRDRITMLRYEAARKAVVRDLLDRADRLSDAEIDGAPVLKWIKETLRLVREHRRGSLRAAAMLDAMEAHIFEWRQPDTPGVMLEWVAPDAFLPFGRRTKLLVPTGALLWLPRGAAGLWYDTAHQPNVDPRVAPPNVVEIGPRTKTEYAVACRERTNARAIPPAATEISSGIPGLRITRLP